MATVKKVAKTSDEARAEYNAREARKTKAAKSGATARLMASAEQYLEKNEPGRGNKKTIKINSNPVPGKTRIGNLAGGGLGGGMFGIKNR